MRSIACSYAGVARNWLRAGVLSNPRVIYGRQFELDSEDDVLVSVPSTDLFIDENKKLLTDLSRHHYSKAGMICRDTFEAEDTEQHDKKEDEKNIYQSDEIPLNYPGEQSYKMLADLSRHHYSKAGMICRDTFEAEDTEQHDKNEDEKIIDQSDDIPLNYPGEQSYKMLADLSRHYYSNAGMICRNKFEEEVAEQHDNKEDEYIPPEDSPRKYPDYQSYEHNESADFIVTDNMTFFASKIHYNSAHRPNYLLNNHMNYPLWPVSNVNTNFDRRPRSAY